jgi:hypothetical protein
MKEMETNATTIPVHRISRYNEQIIERKEIKKDKLRNSICIFRK